jgi:2'-hydroxyisoflavone reductase
MRLLVLGGTRFLGRHVATAALRRGHDVATFTRGVSGEPPVCARPLHGDRDDPDALHRALDGWTPELVVDTSCQTRKAARNAAAVLGDVAGYAFVSSLNAYRTWPPGPVGPEDDEPTWEADDDEYGPIKADAERILGAALGERFLTARAGLIIGPYDPIHRLGWWLDRISRGGRVVVPRGPRSADRGCGRARPGGVVGRGSRAGALRGGQRDGARRDDDTGRAAGPLP